MSRHRALTLLRQTGTVLTLSIAPVVHAAPVVLDFSNYATTGVHNTVNSGGFDFVAASGPLAVAFNATACSPNCAANGTTALVVGGSNVIPQSIAPMTMSTAVYATFRLTGLDYAELSNNSINAWSASSIVLTGTLFGGGTVTQTLMVDGLNDGPGGNADFETAVLDAFWSTSDLVSLQFAGFIGPDANRAFQLDNIALDVSRVAPLPEPASLALVGLALAAACQTRRTRRPS